MSEYCKNCFELAEKLTKKERECKTLKSQLDFAVRQKERFEQQCEALKSEGFTRESLITEQENEIDELRQECEELKGKYEEIKEDRYNLNMEMYTFDRYRKALEEIEKFTKKHCDYWCEHQILDIINKVKGDNR